LKSREPTATQGQWFFDSMGFHQSSVRSEGGIRPVKKAGRKGAQRFPENRRPDVRFGLGEWLKYTRP